MDRRVAVVIAGFVALALLVIGLVVGYGSTSINTRTYGTLDCGSAFAPQNPSAPGLALKTGSTDVYGSSAEPLSQQCESAAAGHRTPALVLLVGGVLVAVGTGLVVGLSRRNYAATTARLNSSR